MNVSCREPIPLFERLVIESHAYCNRACWFCPRTHDRSGGYLNGEGSPVRSEMPTDRILDLLDQAQTLDFRGQVAFHFFCEPLLDRRSPLLAREARKRGMKPYLHTNGDPLRKDDALCREVEGAYEYVVIGLYEYETDAQMKEAQAYWRDRLPRADLRFSAVGPKGARSAHSMGIPRALVPTDPRMSIPDIIYLNAPCRRPLLRMVIRHDGEMCGCCEDTGGAFGLGNVFDSSLRELWYSGPHVEFVRNLIAGHREKYALCANCPLTPSGAAREGERIRMKLRRFRPVNL